MECSFRKLKLFALIFPFPSCSIDSLISELLGTIPNGVFQAENVDNEMKLDVFEECSVPMKIIVLCAKDPSSGAKN